MGLLICLVIGAVVGWLVGAIQEVDEGLFSRMGIGLLGGLIGDVFAGLMHSTAMTTVTWYGVLCSIAGALALLGIASTTSSRNNSRDEI